MVAGLDDRIASPTAPRQQRESPPIRPGLEEEPRGPIYKGLFAMQALLGGAVDFHELGRIHDNLMLNDLPFN